MTNSKPVSNDKIYDLINNTRLELKGDIGSLRNQFDNLEAGRLTRAEGNINELRVELQKAINTINNSIDSVKQAGGTLSAKAAIIGSITIIILTGASAAIFYRLVVQ